MFDCNFWKAEIFWLSDQVNTPLVFHSEPRLSMPGELQLQLTSLSSLRHSLKRTMKKTVCEEHRARCSIFSDLLLHIAIHCYMYHNLDELDLLCWSKSMFFPSVKLFILPPYLHALRQGFITIHRFTGFFSYLCFVYYECLNIFRVCYIGFSDLMNIFHTLLT